MITKTLADISIDDLDRLVQQGVTESQNLEYKREVWDRGDEGVREMLRDISAMANGYGGHLVLGVNEDAETGRAVGFVTIPSAEEERDRILSSCLANLQPRVMGLDIKTVARPNGEQFLVMRIPNSLNLHQITFKGLYQFWMRHDRQKAKMSTDEVRDVILKNHYGVTESKDLLVRRRAEVQQEGARVMLLSAAPLRAGGALFSVDDQRLREILANGRRERQAGWNLNVQHYSQTRPSLNGLRVLLASADGGFVELYRGGYLEARVVVSEGHLYDLGPLRNDAAAQPQAQMLNGLGLVEMVRSFCNRLRDVMDHLAVEQPYMVGLALYNIGGMVLGEYSHRAIRQRFETWDEQHLGIEPILFEHVEPEHASQQLADRLYQAFHFESAPYFTDGHFDPR